MSSAAEKRIAGFHRFGSVLGLERISMLCEKLGSPQKGMKVIHVARDPSAEAFMRSFRKTVFVQAFIYPPSSNGSMKGSSSTGRRSLMKIWTG